MHRYLVIALWSFIAGVAVAFLWLTYLNGAIGESGHPVTAIGLMFPGLFIRWPGMPKALTGSQILLFFALSTVSNGIIYAAVAVGIRGLATFFHSQNSN
jgi:hypothetical protein